MPTDRLTFEKQQLALRTVALLSRNGTDEVTAEDMARTMSVVPASAALNNAFFVHVGLMTRATRGAYKPTQVALEYQRAFSFDGDAAGPILADNLKGGWFWEPITQLFELRGADLHRDHLVRMLAAQAGTDDSYSTQYGHILGWLVHAGLLIATGDDLYRLASDQPSSSVAAAQVRADASTASNEPPVMTPDTGRPEQESRVSAQRGPAIISLSVDIHVTAEDLAKLQPEQIAALFDGVGKIAATKALLDQ